MKKKAPPGPAEPGKKAFHRHVERAIAHNAKAKEDKRRHVQIHYQKLNGRTVKRKVTPYAMKGNIMVGFDHKRKETRSYRMERVKHMEKSAFWAGFEKQASAFAHAAELGGLGLLAHGSVKHLSGKPLTEDRTHKEEIAGLGILAAPSAHAAAVGTRDAFRAARKGAKGAVGAGAIAQGAWKGIKKWHQATGH